MRALNKLPAYWMTSAEERFYQLDADQQERVLALLSIIRVTPSTGIFYGKTPQNRVLQIVTEANAHLVYTLMYARVGQAIIVVDCFIEDWDMDDETGSLYST